MFKSLLQKEMDALVLNRIFEELGAQEKSVKAFKIVIGLLVQ